MDNAPFFKASTENCPLPHPRSRIVRSESPSSMSRLIRIVLLGDNPFRWYSSQWSRALESKCSLIHFVPSAFSQQAPVKPNSPRGRKEGFVTYLNRGATLLYLFRRPRFCLPCLGLFSEL